MAVVAAAIGAAVAARAATDLRSHCARLHQGRAHFWLVSPARIEQVTALTDDNPCAAALSLRYSSPGDDAMSEYEFTVSLRIRHPNIAPSSITETLGIEPQHTWKAGDPRRDPTGGDCTGVYRESYWMGRLMDEPQLSSGRVSVESVLLQTLTQLRRAQSFLEQLNIDGGVAELCVSLFARENFRLELSADSLTLLGRLRLAVALDVQPHASFDAPPPTSN